MDIPPFIKNSKILHLSISTFGNIFSEIQAEGLQYFVPGVKKDKGIELNWAKKDYKSAQGISDKQ